MLRGTRKKLWTAPKLPIFCIIRLLHPTYSSFFFPCLQIKQNNIDVFPMTYDQNKRLANFRFMFFAKCILFFEALQRLNFYPKHNFQRIAGFNRTCADAGGCCVARVLNLLEWRDTTDSTRAKGTTHWLLCCDDWWREKNPWLANDYHSTMIDDILIRKCSLARNLYRYGQWRN